jgi:hypothetical protein
LSPGRPTRSASTDIGRFPRRLLDARLTGVKSDRPPGPRRHHEIARRLIQSRTPSERLYSKYREWADLYVDAHRRERPILRLPDGHEVRAQLGFRRSILFGRDYLVAWVDDGLAFQKAMPEMDAVMSPVSVSWMPVPLPLIVAPGRRRQSRSEGFQAVIEHEVVHANQAILGLRIPELQARSLSRLRECFFTYTGLEHEAHFIQSVRWPLPLNFGEVVLSLEEWVLLRAYTPALEEILRRTALGRIPKGIIANFLDEVPKRAPLRLARMGCSPDLVRWFQARWAADVSCALQVLDSQGVDLQGAPLRSVFAWLGDKKAARDPEGNPVGSWTDPSARRR